MINNTNFEIKLNEKQREFDIRLENLFNKEDILSISSKYAITNGGKRLRPLLLIEFAKLFSEIDENMYDFAIALELIHNYSLVHDDLPSMDNDDYRRGNLTVHKKYGEDIAILVGDNLLNKSYEIILEILSKTKKQNLYIEAGRYLAYQSGESGMIGGQIFDINNKFENIDDILAMYTKKTCGLIKAACKSGAIISGASKEKILLAEEFGEVFGLSYQIQDDLLDYNQDLKINKKTVANFNSKENATDLLKKNSERAISILEEINGDTEFLELLVKYLINRKY